MVPKVTLQMEDGFFGNFQFDNQASLVAPILTLSTGGLNIAIPKKTCNLLKNGVHLKLICINGTANLNFISDIPSEIIAIEKQYHENYMSADCKFLDLEENTRQQIIRLVDHERKMRGQYG
jgi:c-di-GMP-binding flagellar brake protein YcgR